MPIESIIVLVAIVLAFGIFATALAWADAQTRGLAQPAQEQPAAEERKAA